MTTLQEIYAKIPYLRCKRLCKESCGPVPATALERKALTAACGGALPATGSLTCPALTTAGLCGGYGARPVLCRLWGVTPAMACPWGCEPERWLSDAEARALLDEAERIGGPVGLIGGGDGLASLLGMGRK